MNSEVYRAELSSHIQSDGTKPMDVTSPCRSIMSLNLLGSNSDTLKAKKGIILR